MEALRSVQVTLLQQEEGMVIQAQHPDPEAPIQRGAIGCLAQGPQCVPCKIYALACVGFQLGDSPQYDKDAHLHVLTGWAAAVITQSCLQCLE